MFCLNIWQFRFCKYFPSLLDNLRHLLLSLLEMYGMSTSKGVNILGFVMILGHDVFVNVYTLV